MNPITTRAGALTVGPLCIPRKGKYLYPYYKRLQIDFGYLFLNSHWWPCLAHVGTTTISCKLVLIICRALFIESSEIWATQFNLAEFCYLFTIYSSVHLTEHLM